MPILTCLTHLSMESIAISTNEDFDRHSSYFLKRKTHSSIACGCCRKLKIRCRGGESGLTATSSSSKACDNCVRLGKVCTWREDDGRKRQKQTTTNPRIIYEDASQGEQNSPATWASNPPTSPCRVGGLKLSNDHGQVAVDKTASPVRERRNNHQNWTGEIELDQSLHRDSAQHHVFTTPSAKPAMDSSYTTLQYYRHLGPTAIAPGHKKVSLKIRQDFGVLPRDQSSSSDGHPVHQGHTESSHSNCLLPLFDRVTNLPATELLPQLLDSFFQFYGDNFCFLNRQHLSSLLERGQASSFLICAISALSSRVCPPEIFEPYFSVGEAQDRESWAYSLPFLERAKTLLMPLLNIPSCDVVAGMLLLSWADFGDNNEAGMDSSASRRWRISNYSRPVDVHRHVTENGARIGPASRTSLHRH